MKTPFFKVTLGSKQNLKIQEISGFAGGTRSVVNVLSLV